MTARKTTEEIAAIYAAVSSKDNLLYHVAHARKENSDKEYDGDNLVRIALERGEDDISDLLDVSEAFRTKSIPRD